MRNVKVTLTANRVGMGLIYPYQRHMHVTVLAVYEVPLYELRVEPSTTFKAVRFGLTPLEPPPSVRTCNTGLNAYHKVTPTWVDYSPHSFSDRGTGRRGAWLILEGKQFLLHEGADPDATPPTIGGSLGCVEVIKASEWNRFLNAIEAIGGGSCRQIGAAKSLTLTIEATSFPAAHLRGTMPVSH